MSRKTPLLSPRSAASTRAVESGSVSLNSPEDCMSVEPVRFHDIAANPCLAHCPFRDRPKFGWGEMTRALRQG
eukprot:scaffold30926_cov62-Phaeocystis_antarctica.AAC.10